MANSAPRTFDAKRAQTLYEDGHGCNAIARELGCSPSTVSKWAKESELKFDRSQTALAVRAHVIDLAEARTLLAQKMAVAASDLLDSLDGKYLVYSFGGRDNTYNDHELDRPPVEVIRNAVTTAAIAVDKASKILEGINPGQSEALSILETLAKTLGVRGPDA
jgi:predicted transcriptional regulator